MGIVHRQREIPAELRDITGPGDALPVAMTVDALGNVFAPDDNYVLQPTGGLVHIIDAAAVTPADRARQRQLLTELTMPPLAVRIWDRDLGEGCLCAAHFSGWVR